MLERINSLAGDKADSDEVLTLIEDVSDTFGHFEENSNIDWEEKYHKNDKEWRERYRARFFNEDVDDKDLEPEENKPPKTLRFEDLFKE